MGKKRENENDSPFLLMCTQRLCDTFQASIQQELEESEAQRLQRVASLEAELLALRTTLGAKEEEIVNLQEQIDSKVITGIIHVFCLALTFVGSGGSCLNSRPKQSIQT